MVVLILGANGQVGYELADCTDTEQVITLTRDQVDFTRPGDVSAAVDEYNPDIVINAVAYTAVDKAESEPSVAMQINGVAVQELARACAKHNAWCIHYSTDYVFDGTSTEPYKETDTVNPLGIYGQTKLAGEEYIQQETDKYLILRTSWVYSWRGANFVKTMLRLADQKDELNIVSDQQGCPTYARDIAQATTKIIDQLSDDVNLSGIYHLTGAETTTWYDFARDIFKLSNKSITVNPIPTNEFPTPAARPNYSILDNSKLKAAFGITVPGYSDSLKQCLSQLSLD